MEELVDEITAIKTKEAEKSTFHHDAKKGPKLFVIMTDVEFSSTWEKLEKSGTTKPVIHLKIIR